MNKTALYLAVEKGNIEIIKLLANCKFDINVLNIKNIFLFIKFENSYFNCIQNYMI